MRLLRFQRVNPNADQRNYKSKATPGFSGSWRADFSVSPGGVVAPVRAVVFLSRRLGIVARRLHQRLDSVVVSTISRRGDSAAIQIALDYRRAVFGRQLHGASGAVVDDAFRDSAWV